jgi:gamma-tubulin complex component 5
MRQLRAFARAIFNASYAFPSSSHTQGAPSTPTLEAFAAAIDCQVRKFTTWCAAYEEGPCVLHSGPSDKLNICSLLSLEHRTSEFMGASFDLLLSLVHDILSLCSPATTNMQAPKSEECPFNFSLVHPSVLCTFMLDALIAAARGEHLKGLSGSAQLIMDVFTITIEPLWNSLGTWMRRGMAFEHGGTLWTAGSRKQSELFIQRDENIPINHIDFWLDGYKVSDKFSQDLSMEQVRSARPHGFEHHSIPMIFRAFANEILSAGKSVGLLRVLQSDDLLSLEASGFHSHPLQDWPSFREIIRSSTDHISPDGDERDAVSRRSLPHVLLDGERADAFLRILLQTGHPRLSCQARMLQCSFVRG